MAATEADIPIPVCEARGEQVGNFVDNVIKISVSDPLLQKQNQDDKHNELPIVEGENFLKSPSIVEVHCEANNSAPDLSKVGEETLAEERQQNAEESNSKDRTDDAMGVTQLSKQTSSNHHGAYDSSTENVALTKEILQESSLSSEEIESHTPCISQGEELNGDHFNTAAEKASHENSTSGETITTLDTFNGNELSSKTDLNTSLSKEECRQNAEESISKDGDGDGGVVPEQCSMDSTVVTSEIKVGHATDDPCTDNATDVAELSKETSSDHHGTYDSTTEDNVPAALDNGKDKYEDLKEAELSENELSTSTLVKEDVQKENPTESFYKASESIEASNLSQENSVKGHREEQNRDVSLNGDTTDAADEQNESLETCPQIVSSSHEEGSMAAVLKEAMSDNADGKMIDEVDKHKEVLENLSSGEGHCEGNNVALDISTGTEKTDQTVKDGPALISQPVELAANEETFVKEIQQNVEESNSTDKNDGRDVVPEVCSMYSSVVTTDIKMGDRFDDPDVDDAKVVTQLSKDTSSHHHGTDDSSTENVALTGEILHETNIPSETESHTHGISEGEELNAQDKTTENKSVDENPTNEDISCTLKNEVSKGESYQNKMTLEQEGLENERSVEDDFNTAEDKVSHENSTSGETLVTLETPNSDELQSNSDLNSSLAKEAETAEQKTDKSVTAPEDYGVPSEETLSESHRDEACQSETLEDAATDHSDPKLAEKSEESLLVQVQDTQIQDDEHLEEESERLPLTEKSTAGTYDNAAAATDKVKDEDEDHEEAELSESEQSTKCTLVKDVRIENPAESLHVEPENTEVPDLSQENSTKGPLEEQSRNVTLHGNTVEAKEARNDADDEQKESHESFPPNVSSSHEEGSIAAVPKEATSDHRDGEIIDEVDNHKEVLEDISTEEEMAIRKSDESVTTTVDYGVSSERTLSESHGDVECQSKTLEEASIDYSNPKLAEKSEESSLVQVEDSHIEHDEHLEDGSKGLPLTESSIGSTNDNVSAATDKVKDEVEDHKEAELLESEQTTKSTLVKEDMQIENPAESLHEPLENIQVSTLSQENSSKALPEEQSTTENLQGNIIEAEEATIDAADGPKDSHESFPPNVSDSPEEGSMNAVLEEVTIGHTDQKIIDEVDKHKEVIENLSTNVSTEEAEGNSLIKLEGSGYKKEDDSGKGSEETPLPLPLAQEIGDASIFLHEAQHEDGDTQKAEFCDDERDTESMLPKAEPRTENREDVLVNSEETEAPYSVDKISEGGIVDAAAEKEETIEVQNVPTIIPNEKVEENSFVQVDGQEIEGEEHLDKENEQLSSTKDYTVDAHNDEVIVKDEGKTEDENPSGAELFGKDKNIESVLLTEKVQSEKPVESSRAALEDIKTSDVGQCTEATSILEEKIPTENSQGVPSDETGIDAGANTNEKNQELQNVSNDDRDKDLLVEVAASEMTRERNLGEEAERPSLTETSKEEASDNESRIQLEPKIDDEYQSKVELPNDEESTDCTTAKKESLQSKDHKTSTSSADIETTCSLKEQSLAENSQTIISNTITDATDKEELALQNVATETPHEHIEENAITQVDCSVREHEERLEEDNQISFTEVPTEETDATDSKITNVPESRGEESITPELESGENTESTYVKEETDLEKPIGPLQVKPEDVKQHDSSSEITKSIKEEISNTDPRETSTDKADRESVDKAHKNEETVETKDVAKDIPDCDKEDRIPIEEVVSQNPMNEASAGNTNDEESTKIIEGCLITKEPLEPLQVAAQDIETPPLSRDRETGSLDEESHTTHPEKAIMDENKVEIAKNATGEKDETPKDKDIGKDISDCVKEDNIPIEEVGSQKPLNEASTGNANNEESTNSEGSLIREEASLKSFQEPAQEIETPPLSRDREITSLDEQSPIAIPEAIRDDHKEEIPDNETGLEGETLKDKQDIANTTAYEDKEENLQVQEDCSRLEQNESENIPSSEAPAVSSTESSPAKEEEKVEKPTQEKILTADPQETCDETQEKTADAAKGNNDIVISVPSGNSEDNSTIEVDGLQEPSSEEVSAEKFNDDNEGKVECALVKEEIDIESLQVADVDIKDTSPGQDTEASKLEEKASTTDSHGTMGDDKDAKTLDSHDLKEETLEDKSYATTPDESAKEDSLNQVDGLLLEHEVHLEKDSESTSLHDASKDDVTESTLVREVAHVEDPTDSSQVAIEDIKAFSPCQDTERSSSVEHILDPEDISSNKITEKIVDATGEEIKEAQDTAKSVPQEDDSPNEKNTEVTLIKEDVSTDVPQIAAEDKEEPCFSEVKDTNSQEEEILCASPQVCINDNEENKTTAPTVFENETPNNEVPKEMESVDVKGETKEEEGYLQAVQMTTAVTEASNQERSLNLKAEETPYAEDLNVNKDGIGHIPEVGDYKQQDSPVMKVSEHIMTSNEHVLDSTSMESEVSEKNNDQVTGEANSCGEPGDKTNLEKIEVINDVPTALPTSETLAEIDSRGCTETVVQVPNIEKEAEVTKQEEENDQENIKEILTNYAASEDVSEPKEVDGEEEIDSNNLKEISSSPISVASEEVSKSNVALEENSTSNSVPELETKKEEEAPEIKETTPSFADGQDAESVIVEENSNYTGSLPEEKSDSTEVALTPGENKSGSKSFNRGLESIAQVQSFDIISKTEETETEEEDLKAEAELQSDEAVTKDISQEETMCEKEIMKYDISSKKEQSPRIKEDDKDIKDPHRGSCEEEVIKDSHQEDEVKQDQHTNLKETYEFTKNKSETEMVPRVSEEADDNAPGDLEEKIITNEILHPEPEEQAMKIDEPTAKIDNEQARDLDIACVKTDTQDSNKEGVQIAITPGRESEEQNKEDEICTSDKLQENLTPSEGKSEEEAKETYKEAYFEAEKIETKDISECAISDIGQETLEDNEKSTSKKFSEEDYPTKVTECEVSSNNEDIALREQPSEDALVTAEVQEAKAGIDMVPAVPVPEATGVESQLVEELNDNCTAMADTSKPVEALVISTSENIGEGTEGTPQEAKDQETKLHDLPEESNMRDTEVQMAEKDETVNLQSVRDISEDVQDQKLCKESFGASSNHNPVEGNPEERIEAREGQETKPIQHAPVSETLKQEIEEQQLGRDTMDFHEEEKNICNIPNQLESVNGADREKVPESSIHESSVENTAEHDTKEGNDLPVHVGGLEPEASHLSLKDKHVVLEADDTRNLKHETPDGDKNISKEHSLGEHEVVEPSKVEQQNEECRNEERTDQEIEGKPEPEETTKPSLPDLLQVSTKGTSQMADHAPTEKEPTSHTEELHGENIDEAEHENMKTDEEKDDEEESHEQKKSDLGSEATVMVDNGDADMKVAHKKSHNILSGVGSKVKHSIAKVKKAITGKSPSPKKVINPESK